MTGFHNVRFPLALSLATSGGPERFTEIVRLTSGREVRNQRMAQSRRRYDAGSAVTSLDALYELVAFFEARMGELYAFRFRDPVDFSSGPPTRPPDPADQRIGTGDGQTKTFALVKTYGEAVRPIRLPEAASVRIAVSGNEQPPATFSVDDQTGIVTLASPPPPGAAVTAGFRFDCAVRFDIARIDVSLTDFAAGRVPSVPLVEVLS